VASAVCQCYDQVLPSGGGRREGWRFAATGDVVKLRFVVGVVKLRRRGSIAYGVPVSILDMNTSSPRDAVLCVRDGSMLGLSPACLPADSYEQVVCSIWIAGSIS